MGDVINLPRPEFTPRKVLEAAIQDNISDVVIVGWQPDGQLFISSVSHDPGHVVEMLKAAIAFFGGDNANS